MRLALSRIQVCFFVLDEPNDLPGELIKDGDRGDVDHHELNTAHICAGHRNLFHIINAADAFDHRRNLFPVLFDNPPIDLVMFFLHLGGGFFDEFPVPMRGVEERIDVG